VSSVTVSPVPANPAATATYTVGFTTTVALAANVGTITIVGPTNTVFPAAANDYTVGTAPASVVTALPARSGLNTTVTIVTPVGVAIGSTSVVITGVTNPGTGTPTLTVATSGDTVAATSGTYSITGAAALQVSALTVSPSPQTTGVMATYTVGFTATTGLTGGTGTITMATAGITFPAITGSVYTVKAGGGTATAVIAGTPASGTVTITTPVTITAAQAVQVVITGLLNPAVGPHTLSVLTSGDTTALASAFYSITAVGGGGGGATTPATPVRLSGADRFGTAIAASLVEFPTALSASAVVLARSDDYPDALVGTALATARNAPLLFANGGALTAATVTEIQRVLPAGGTVYLLGGLAAVPASVATTLTGLGFVVVRYGGADRFATSLLVADALGDPSTVLLATGINFPDALAAGPAAAHVAGVVLLTDGTVLTAAVRAYLTGHPGKVYAIGGPAVTADPAATPLSGADRYGTAAAVAAALFTAPNNVGVASGTQFPDALSGGAFQGHFGGPIVLTDPGVLPAPTSAYLTSADTTIVTTSIFGGTAALSTAVQTSISTALGL
jgi:putative cell wall-binding protein